MITDFHRQSVLYWGGVDRIGWGLGQQGEIHDTASLMIMKLMVMIIVILIIIVNCKGDAPKLTPILSTMGQSNVAWDRITTISLPSSITTTQ
jgi:hypothetical protein